jgi:nucleotide sugar dehydrogenase
MKVVLVGAGNMGISWAGAALLNGHEVSIVDNDEGKLTAFRDGKLTQGEEDLWKCIDRGSVQLYSDFSDAPYADIVFIAVQTPSKHEAEWYSCDFGPLTRLLDSLAPKLQEGQIVLLGSTVFPGAIDEHILPRLKDAPITLAYQPVFLRAGNGVTDYLHPAKTVVGVVDPENPPQKLHQFLKSTTWNSAPINYCTYKQAEFVKLMHNTFMCVKINFANEIGDMCARYGVDAERAIELTFNESPEGRLLTRSHMMPGPPFSGTCLPKDSAILTGILESQKLICKCPMLGAAYSNNDDRIHAIIYSLFPARSVGIIGMAYRPGYNDVRDSLAVKFADIANSLNSDTSRFEIHFWDPVFSAMSEQAYMLAARRDLKVEALWPQVVPTLGDLIARSDALIVNCKLDDAGRKLLAIHQELKIVDLYGNGIRKDE